MNSQDFEAARNSHPQDVKEWEKDLEQIEALVDRARANVLETLKNDALGHHNSSDDALSRLERELFGDGLESSLMGLLMRARVEDVFVGHNGISVEGRSFGDLEHFTCLDDDQRKALKARMLFEQVKSLPFQATQEEHFKGLPEAGQDDWVEEDKRFREAWLSRRAQLIDLLAELGKLNISPTGVVMPPYLRVVK